MNPFLANENTMKSPVIVALDFTDAAQVHKLTRQLDPSLCRLKVGKELFTSCGPKLVEELVVSGYDVFLDLKFHDIPNTVYKACKAAANLGVWMIDVHASGGRDMLEAARLAIDEIGYRKPLLIAVTVLTSMSESNLIDIGVTAGLNSLILNLAKLSYKYKLDGVVCSAHEAAMIKNATATNFLAVTPGIRLPNDNANDQARIMTPCAAVQHKADYLVIGRPITAADDPKAKLMEIINSLNTGNEVVVGNLSSVV